MLVIKIESRDDDPTPTAQQVPPTTPNYVVMNAAAVSSSYQQITTVLSEMKGSIATSQPVTKSEFHEFGRQVESTLTTMQKTQKDFMAQMGSFALRGRGARSRHRSSHHSRKGKERASGPNPFAMETDADNEADDQDDAANDTGNETWKERAERKLIEMGEFSKDSMRSSLLVSKLNMFSLNEADVYFCRELYAITLSLRWVLQLNNSTETTCTRSWASRTQTPKWRSWNAEL